MAKTITGHGRVTISRLIHMWEPRRIGIMAYTSTGDYGATGVVAYVPDPDVPDMPLWDVAARHHPAGLGDWRSPIPGHSEACWLLCTGTGSRLTRYPSTLDMQDVGWRLNVDRRHEMGQPMYGHTAVMTGRLTLDDPELMARARALLSPEDRAAMSAADLPPHSV